MRCLLPPVSARRTRNRMSRAVRTAVSAAPFTVQCILACETKQKHEQCLFQDATAHYSPSASQSFRHKQRRASVLMEESINHWRSLLGMVLQGTRTYNSIGRSFSRTNSAIEKPANHEEQVTRVSTHTFCAFAQQPPLTLSRALLVNIHTGVSSSYHA